MNRLICIACFALSVVAFSGCAALPNEDAVLKAGGNTAETIIKKARTTLSAQQVFASRGVGYGAQPSSGCWALTVLVRYDRQAKQFFEEVCHYDGQPAAKLYAVAGLLTLDPKTIPDFASLHLDHLLDTRVPSLDGCDGDPTVFSRMVTHLTEHGTSKYVYDRLPSLYQTVDCSKFPADTP